MLRRIDTMVLTQTPRGMIVGKAEIFNFYCVLAIYYLLSTIKVNKLFY